MYVCLAMGECAYMHLAVLVEFAVTDSQPFPSPSGAVLDKKRVSEIVIISFIPIDFIFVNT